LRVLLSSLFYVYTLLDNVVRKMLNKFLISKIKSLMLEGVPL
jgi:hypothetical protein